MAVVLSFRWFNPYSEWGAVPQSPIPACTERGSVGSIVDLLFVIPLLTYLFIIRKRYPLKYMGIVILVCYLVAYFIIPTQHLQSFNIIPYIILTFEALFLFIELYIVCRVLVKLPNIIRSFRNETTPPFFYPRAASAFSKHLSINRMIEILLSEITMFYYALFSWRKKPPIQEGKYFSYHKNTSVIAFYIMLIHATVLETIGLHVLLHQWSVVLAWVLLAINIYGVLFFIGEIHAIRLSPFMIHKNVLHLQVGLMKSTKIPLDTIEQFRNYDGKEKLSKLKQKQTLDATVKDINVEEPSFEIVLREDIEVHLMYGLKKTVNCVLLTIDDVQRFKQALNEQGVPIKD